MSAKTIQFKREACTGAIWAFDYQTETALRWQPGFVPKFILNPWQVGGTTFINIDNPVYDRVPADYNDFVEYARDFFATDKDGGRAGK